jgi:hypothetical protein
MKLILLDLMFGRNKSIILLVGLLKMPKVSVFYRK